MNIIPLDDLMRLPVFPVTSGLLVHFEATPLKPQRGWTYAVSSSVFGQMTDEALSYKVGLAQSQGWQFLGRSNMLPWGMKIYHPNVLVFGRPSLKAAMPTQEGYEARLSRQNKLDGLVEITAAELTLVQEKLLGEFVIEASWSVTPPSGSTAPMVAWAYKELSFKGSKPSLQEIMCPVWKKYLGEPNQMANVAFGRGPRKVMYRYFAPREQVAGEVLMVLPQD